MADLVAKGPETGQEWRRTLPARSISLGRLEKCEWDVRWDDQISRLHAMLMWKDGKLHVQKEQNAKNPVFFQGKVAASFVVGIGENFVIGKTKFFLEESEISSNSAVSELTCSPQELEQVRYGNAMDRLDVLAKLPNLIRQSPTDEEFTKQVLHLLLSGMPQAQTASIVELTADNGGVGQSVIVRCSCARGGPPASVQPSRRLIVEAVRRRRQPVLHRWLPEGNNEYTAFAGNDWAMCAPLPDDPTPGWALYITGQARQPFSVNVTDPEVGEKEDLKFAGLVADIFGSLRHLMDLQHRKGTLESFFCPAVVSAFMNKNVEEVLSPRQTEATVLFCDLRGFSRISEGEFLEDILERVSDALGVMTRNIVNMNGVISDFQGDAAMGFWGWPISSEDQVEDALSAAMAIRREFYAFHKNRNHRLVDLSCGIGIAHGPAIAGRLGTNDQCKIGVFGPVVNLASRLESLTKHFQVSILVDDNVVTKLGLRASSKFRFRKLARICPYGMKNDTVIHELMLPQTEPRAMSQQSLFDFNAGVNYFFEGRWRDALALLEERLPTDRPSQLIVEYIRAHAGKPPEGWNGIMMMASK